MDASSKSRAVIILYGCRDCTTVMRMQKKNSIRSMIRPDLIRRRRRARGRASCPLSDPVGSALPASADRRRWRGDTGCFPSSRIVPKRRSAPMFPVPNWNPIDACSRWENACSQWVKKPLAWGCRGTWRTHPSRTHRKSRGDHSCRVLHGIPTTHTRSHNSVRLSAGSRRLANYINKGTMSP